MQVSEKVSPLPFMQHLIIWMEGRGFFKNVHEAVMYSTWREEQKDEGYTGQKKMMTLAS